MNDRRGFLKGGAVGIAAVLAGCSGSISGDTGPQYDQDHEFAFELETVRERLSEDWEIPDEPANDSFEYEFDLYDDQGNLVAFVMANSLVTESVDQAQANLEEWHADHDEEAFELADEAYVWEESNHAWASFRESNALAEVVGARVSGREAVPDTTRAINGARAFHDNW